jgi:hypothetical protein
MAPLPCSPVSNSTGTEDSSFSSHHPSEDDRHASDDSLTTPRPGPSDPAQRTQANLSRPSVPSFGSSPEASGKGKAWAGSSSPKRDRNWEAGAAEGKPRNPYTYSSSPKSYAAPGAVEVRKAEIGERQKSISFSPQTSLPKAERQGSYGLAGMMAGKKGSSPAVSPHSEARDKFLEEPGESSADENTAIFPRDRLPGVGAAWGSKYGSTIAGANGFGNEPGNGDEPNMGATGYDGGRDEPGSTAGSGNMKKRKFSALGRSKAGKAGRGQEVQQAQAGAEAGQEEGAQEQESWWRMLVDKYGMQNDGQSTFSLSETLLTLVPGSVELENKGSVARDHLALGGCQPFFSFLAVCNPCLPLRFPNSFPIRSYYTPSCPQLSNTMAINRAHLPRLAPHLPLIRQHRHCRHAALPSQHFALRLERADICTAASSSGIDTNGTGSRSTTSSRSSSISGSGGYGDIPIKREFFGSSSHLAHGYGEVEVGGQAVGGYIFGDMYVLYFLFAFITSLPP